MVIPVPGFVERAIPVHRRAFLRKAVSFGLIGMINSAIDFGIFLLVYSHVPDTLAGKVIANVLAWIVAVSCSYVMNSFITFAAESGRRLRWRDYLSFLTSGVAGLIANTTTVVVASLFMPVWAAKGLAIGASFLVNFSLSHFVVFRQRPATRSGMDQQG
jgi:putative flippase GtrA